jgi:bacillithiol system protein YtxJ
MLIPLLDQPQTDTFLAEGGMRWVFKHSNTCPISTAAYEEVQTYLTGADEPVGMVVVQTHRPISNSLATRLGYTHQSPQLFLVQNDKVLWQASHWSITSAAMTAARSKAGTAASA